jgi:hypothetical protein
MRHIPRWSLPCLSLAWRYCSKYRLALDSGALIPLSASTNRLLCYWPCRSADMEASRPIVFADVGA